MPLTISTLMAVMPHCPLGRVRSFIGPLDAAMTEANISTPLRQAAFLAQLAHESGDLRFWEELADGSAYEGRAKTLGNTQPGDGPRFKGRGPIQLTGRANYRAAGEALGVPLEQQPELAATVDVGFRVAAWFWTSRGLNALADAGDFDGITRRINGGFTGKADRDARYLIAKRVLGVTPTPGV